MCNSCQGPESPYSDAIQAGEQSLFIALAPFVRTSGTKARNEQGQEISLKNHGKISLQLYAIL